MDNAKCNVRIIFEAKKKTDVYTAVISPQTILSPVLSCMFLTSVYMQKYEKITRIHNEWYSRATLSHRHKPSLQIWISHYSLHSRGDWFVLQNVTYCCEFSHLSHSLLDRRRDHIL